MTTTKQLIQQSLQRDVERLEQKLAKAKRRPVTFDDYDVKVERAQRELDAARRAMEARA